jgi:hypothetical protein
MSMFNPINAWAVLDLARRESAKKISSINFKRFRDWRRDEITKQTPYSCLCTQPQSIASGMHDIVLHVCEKHAKQFGIHSGPYWQEEVLAILDRV